MKIITYKTNWYLTSKKTKMKVQRISLRLIWNHLRPSKRRRGTGISMAEIRNLARERIQTLVGKAIPQRAGTKTSCSKTTSRAVSWAIPSWKVAAGEWLTPMAAKACRCSGSKARIINNAMITAKWGISSIWIHSLHIVQQQEAISNQIRKFEWWRKIVTGRILAGQILAGQKTIIRKNISRNKY